MRHLRFGRQDIDNLIDDSDSLGLSPKARERLEWFKYAVEHNDNVSETCRHFGIARSTFLRWAERFDPNRPHTLEDQSRRPHNVRQTQVAPRVIALIEKYRKQYPTMNKERICTLLKSEHDIEISPSTVGRTIQRFGLFFADTISHQRKRQEADRPLPEVVEEVITESETGAIHHEPIVKEIRDAVHMLLHPDAPFEFAYEQINPNT